MRSRLNAWTPASEREYCRRAILRAAPRNRPALRRFVRWLEIDRGYCPVSMTLYLKFVLSFVHAVTSKAGMACARAFRHLTPVEVEDFFVRYAKRHGRGAVRATRYSMCLFLRFAASRGWAAPDLADAIPTLRTYRLSSVPRALDDRGLRSLIKWVMKPCTSARDRAIVLLLAVYGVRRAQVSNLRFADIDWSQRTLTFPSHKGGKPVKHALVPAVAEAIARYLREERPAADYEQIFLRWRSPKIPMSPTAINHVVRSRLKLAGVPPRSAHALRHAFATRLLRTGHPAKAIADLLGHRTLASIAFYAKLDHHGLLQVAVDWPRPAP